MASAIRVIGFLDIDAFECQMWQKDFPETRGKPCVVATNSGLIVSVTHEAKALGISRGDTPKVREAKKKCPILHVFTKPDKFGKQDQSKCRLGTWMIVKSIQDFLQELSITDVVMEVASSDEIYLDISAEVTRGMDSRQSIRNGAVRPVKIPSTIVWERSDETKRGPFLYHQNGPPITDHHGVINKYYYANNNQERLIFGGLFMDRLCNYVEIQTQLKSSAGVAKNKLMAKIGCSLNKPGKITVLGAEAFHRVSKLVKISSIPGLGGRIGERLTQKFQIENVTDILSVPFDRLLEEFGNQVAQNIYSWAKGIDVEPVVSKILKDQIKINKPSNDIKTSKRLETVVRGLTSEMEIILYEEECRSFRKTDKVRVDFSIAGGRSFIKDFLISPESYQEIVEHIATITRLEINSQIRVITALTFVLKDFVRSCATIQINNSDELLESDLTNNMTNLTLANGIPMPKPLKLERKCRAFAANLKFQHTVLGKFRITNELDTSENEPILPTLLSETDLQSLVGFNLLQNYDSKATSVSPDYFSFEQIKHRCFSTWLKSEGPKIVGGMDSIDFVSFHGRICRSLKTLCNQGYGNWETYAMNVNGTIYLWDEKTTRSDGRERRPDSEFMGYLFEGLATGKGKDHVPEDTTEKVYVVQKVGFGSHNLLLLSNVDAQDSFGGNVQLTVGVDPATVRNLNHSLQLEKNLKIWAQAVVSGSNKLVIGTRKSAFGGKGKKKWILTSMTTHETDEFRATLMEKEKMDDCFDFLDRFLTLVKSHLPDSNKKLVKTFSWCGGIKNVAVNNVPESELQKLVVPKIYFQ